MSPKEDSKADLMVVASSRDVQPNTDSVIRSRRTYAYDNGTDTQFGSSGSLVLDRVLDRVLDHYIVKIFVRPFVRKPDCVRYRPRNNYLDRSYEIAAATDDACGKQGRPLAEPTKRTHATAAFDPWTSAWRVMTNTPTTGIQARQRICKQGRNGGEGRDESSDRNFRGQDSDPRQLENGTRNDDMTTVQAGSLLTPLSARKVCYYLIAGLVLGVAVSFAIALWWAQSHGDISAAFTIGSYFVAVDALFLAVFTAIHVPKCQCWDM